MNRPLPEHVRRAMEERDRRKHVVKVDPYKQSGGYMACFDKDPNAQDIICHLQKGLNDVKFYAEERASRVQTNGIERVAVADGHRSMECHNCYVAFYPNPELVELMGAHCSPNCALRTYINEFEAGITPIRTHEVKCTRITEFFQMDVKPFPVCTDAYRRDIVGYHFTAIVPASYPIEYYYPQQVEPEKRLRYATNEEYEQFNSVHQEWGFVQQESVDQMELN